MKQRFGWKRFAEASPMVFLACAGWTNVHAAPAADYLITDLGPATSVTAINNDGVAVGVTLESQPALYVDGEIQLLPTLAGARTSRPESINDSGQVVGGSYLNSGQYGAFLYSAGLLQNIGSPPGGNGSWALDINNRSQVVGGTSGLGPGWQPFLYTDGTMTNIGTVPGGTGGLAEAINDIGHVVGYADTPQGLRAFLYSDGLMRNLGTPPGADNSLAVDINNHDQVVGYSFTTAGPNRGFLYSAGSFLNLAMSSATGINDRGQIVGGGDGQALLYSDGSVYALNEIVVNGAGWNLLSAFDINNSGQIVGYASFGGAIHGYLASPIPEVSTGSYLLTGLLFIAAMRRRNLLASKRLFMPLLH